MGLAHDVSHELRGEHGKWSKGGAAIDRMAAEAKASKSVASGSHKEGDRVKYKTGALGTVHHVDEKGKIHVVWDRGRGKPVATPAHHLTSATDKKPAEQAARETTGAKPHVPYKPPRQAGSRGGVPAPTTGPNLKTRPPARGEILPGRAPTPERLKPGGGSKNFPNGSDVNIHSGKYAGESGTVISGGDPLRPGLIQVKRKDGSTILVRESNAGKPAAGMTPELQAQLRNIQAAEKARVEAENKARHPGGSVTEYKDMLNKPNLSGGATPPTKEQQIADLNRQWNNARQLSNTAKAPSTAQAADRRRQDLEKQLEAAGAVYQSRSGWSAPKPGAKPPDHPLVGKQVTITSKLNARSTDPYNGESNPAESFKLIKRGTPGVVHRVDTVQGRQFATVKFQGLNTRQQIAMDMLKESGGAAPRVTASEKQALSNILGIPASDINPGNIEALRTRFRSMSRYGKGQSRG